MIRGERFRHNDFKKRPNEERYPALIIHMELRRHISHKFGSTLTTDDAIKPTSIGGSELIGSVCSLIIVDCTHFTYFLSLLSPLTSLLHMEHHDAERHSIYVPLFSRHDSLQVLTLLLCLHTSSESLLHKLLTRQATLTWTKT